GESGELGVGDIADSEVQQEPVPERLEFTALRHLVARAEERDRRGVRLLAAGVETRSLAIFSNAFRIALLALKISSRKTSSASTSLPAVLRLYSSRLRPTPARRALPAS